jgi:choline dehydrogenase-like flavoprotein
MMDMPAHNEDGVGGMHVYMPWWLDNRKLDFPRGYHIEVGGGRRMPSFGFMGGLHQYAGMPPFAGNQDGTPLPGIGYGKKLKDDYRRFYGATVGFAGRGEMIPNEKSFCEIDPAVVDRYGIPVLRFNFAWTDHEYKQAKHMQDTFRAIIDEMGGTPMTPMPSAESGYGLMDGGRIIHELGVTRMGSNAASSVVNANCQVHDAKNVFVADAGPFVSQPDKNPTWTILALAWRTSDYILEQRRQGNI